jgi:hypothetical protein
MSKWLDLLRRLKPNPMVRPLRIPTPAQVPASNPGEIEKRNGTHVIANVNKKIWTPSVMQPGNVSSSVLSTENERGPSPLHVNVRLHLPMSGLLMIARSLPHMIDLWLPHMIDRSLPPTSANATFIECLPSLVHPLPKHLPCERLPKHNSHLQAQAIACPSVLLHMTAWRLRTSETGCPPFLTNAHHMKGTAYIHLLPTRIHTDKVHPYSRDRASSRRILPSGIYRGSATATWLSLVDENGNETFQ